MSLGLSWLTCSGKVISLKFLLLGTEKQCHPSGNKSFFLMLPCPPDVPTTLQIVLRGKRRELIPSPKDMAIALDESWLTRKIILQLPSDSLRTVKSELWQFKQYTRETSKAHVVFHILSLHELKILKENSSRQGCIYLAEKQSENLLCSACSAFPQYFVSTCVKLRAQILIA